MFGTNTKLNKYVREPLEQGDNPELDTSEMLDNEYSQKYQSLIFSLEWYISLKRFVICSPVMIMSSFISGHMNWVKRSYAYLEKLGILTFGNVQWILINWYYQIIDLIVDALYM